MLCGRLVGGGIEHAADRAQVRVDPRLAVDGLGDGQRARGGRQPGVARRRAPRPRRPAARAPGTARGRRWAAGRRRPPRPWRRGSSRPSTQDGRRGCTSTAPLRERDRPVRATWGGLRSLCEVDPPDVSAAAIRALPSMPPLKFALRSPARHARELAHRRPPTAPRRPATPAPMTSSGAPSGSRQRGERDDAARLAHDQLPRRDVDRARAAQRDHPVQPRRRDLAERHRDRADRAQPVRASRRARPPSRAPSAGRPTRSRAAPACRRRGAPGTLGSSGAPLSVAPSPRARDPLLAGAEVVHEAEADVGHRVAVGDRERERVVRQAALGVLGAVERVDDDAHRPAAEVDAPALLAAPRRTGGPSACSASSRRNTASSAAASISSVAVAALAARAGLPRALGRRRRGGEHLLQLPHGRARGAQPIRSGGAHRPYPTKVPVTENTPCAAGGRHPSGRPAADPRAARAPARRTRWSSASPGSSRRARRPRRSSR